MHPDFLWESCTCESFCSQTELSKQVSEQREVANGRASSHRRSLSLVLCLDNFLPMFPTHSSDFITRSAWSFKFVRITTVHPFHFNSFPLFKPSCSIDLSSYLSLSLSLIILSLFHPHAASRSSSKILMAMYLSTKGESKEHLSR